MASNRTLILKLQRAINFNFPEERLTHDKVQFFSKDQERPVSVYRIKKTEVHEGERNKYIELFSSTSMIQLVLFLRDYWYYLNGWEIPNDNNYWNKARKKYFDSHESPAGVIYDKAE